jgi:hypothetical protein
LRNPIGTNLSGKRRPEGRRFPLKIVPTPNLQNSNCSCAPRALDQTCAALSLRSAKPERDALGIDLILLLIANSAFEVPTIWPLDC